MLWYVVTVECVLFCLLAAWSSLSGVKRWAVVTTGFTKDVHRLIFTMTRVNWLVRLSVRLSVCLWTQRDCWLTHDFCWLSVCLSVCQSLFVIVHIYTRIYSYSVPSLTQCCVCRQRRVQLTAVAISTTCNDVTVAISTCDNVTVDIYLPVNDDITCSLQEDSKQLWQSVPGLPSPWIWFCVLLLLLLLLLGRLLWVDLIKWVSNVRPSVHEKLNLNEIWYVGRGRRVMHDGMQYDLIQGQGHEPLKSEIRPFSTAISSPIYNGGWQMTTDS